MLPPQPPAGFVAIGPAVYISRAPTSATTLQLDDSSPNVILIFGWMGALSRHLQQYSQKYAQLYPHATQIIVKYEQSFVWASGGAQQKPLLPVVEVLESLGCLPISNSSTQESTRVRPRILVHSFSNGGGVHLITLGRLLSSKYPSIPPSEYPVNALILDSSPSVSTLYTIGKTFSTAIRNPIIRYITLIVLYFMHALYSPLRMIFGTKIIWVDLPTRFLQPCPLPWMNAQTPRLYVFSKKDASVPWQQVEQHIEAAKASGLNVRSEVYEESAHVSHMRLDPKRYWESVQDLWRIACHESRVRAVGGNWCRL